MSLHGLDDPSLVEAHELAISEPGGWFLLQYANRDEVKLLRRGHGGFVEMREAVSDYEETSPLYGFLKYRRRSVVVKHLPEGCSRIIQARVAVHFNAVCERFSSYDTILEITTATELKDTKLSSACSLHAASCSTSSSNSSLRRRRLMEITEEEEEENRAPKRQSIEDPNGQGTRPTADSISPVALDAQLSAAPENSKFSAHSTSELPTFVGADDRPTSSAKSSDTDSIRPELFSYSSYPYGKPKVKLRPRPSFDVNGRPQTAGNFRPISAIPAGFKLFGKGSKKGKTDKDRNTLAASQGETTNFDSDLTSFVGAGQSQYSQGDVIGPTAISAAFAEHATLPSLSTPKKPTVSPEKARLIKAMQLREKKKNMGLMVAPSNVTLLDKTSLRTDAFESEGQVMDADQEIKTLEDESGAPSVVLADQKSDLTQTDSRPSSPIVTSFEADQSTKASSLSESTEETMQAKNQTDFVMDDVETSQSTSPPQTKDDATTAEDAALFDEPEQASLGTSEDQRELTPTSAPDAAPHPEEGNDGGNLEALTATWDADLTDSTAVDTGLDAIVPPPMLETIIDPSLKPEKEGEVSKIMPLPISKFSVDASVPPKPSAEESSGPQHSKTRFHEGEGATALDTNQALFAQSVDPPIAQTRARSNSKQATCFNMEAVRDSTTPQQVIGTSPSVPLEHATARTHEQVESKVDMAYAHETQPRRKGPIEPIRTDIAQHSRQNSTANFSDDEELMEELQSATVQEAKSLLVAKTPVSTTFTNSPVEGRPALGAPHAHIVRTVSSPVRGSFIAPTDVSQSSARSLSSGVTFLHQVTQQQQPQQQEQRLLQSQQQKKQQLQPQQQLQKQLPPPAQGGNPAKKLNMGSSISQRIKALEKLSAGSGDVVAANARERPSSTFFAVKKRESSKPPSVMERANSLRKGIPESRPQSTDSSESGRLSRRDRSGSVTDRLSVFESQQGTNAPSRPPSNSRRGRPESVSVTARIIRDPSRSAQANLNPATDSPEYGRLDLKQSPLLVDHQKAISDLSEATVARLLTERRSASEERAKSSSKSRQSSLSVVKGFIKERRKSVTSSQCETSTVTLTSRSPSRSPTVHQSSTFSSRLSASSRRSSVSRDHESVTSPTGDGLTVEDSKSTNGDKKLSRAGRFMRRLSALSGSRNKNTSAAISHSVTEESPEADIPRLATTGSPTIVSYMGDVNVQFPDTLLWKRRNLSLDSQGFLKHTAWTERPAGSGTQALPSRRISATVHARCGNTGASQ